MPICKLSVEGDSGGSMAGRRTSVLVSPLKKEFNKETKIVSTIDIYTLPHMENRLVGSCYKHRGGSQAFCDNLGMGSGSEGRLRGGNMCMHAC